MSLTGYRDEIASALTQVEGVKGYAYRPTTPTAGDAWPLLTSLDRSEGLVFLPTWRVLVFLPQDERQASQWIDEHHESLVDGLLSVGYVDRMEPVEISNSGQLALQITMRSE